MAVLRRTGSALAFGASLLAATAAPAAADGGACTAAEGHPSCTILRPASRPLRDPPADAPECIVTVGGLGSDNNDDRDGGSGTFHDLLAPFTGDPRYAVHRFGSRDEDPLRFPYDTYGALDVSGKKLRDYVRSLSGGCSSIHIVTHSMGGAVADRAFSMGLSRGDRVVTYLPLSAPHNGAMAARFLRGLVDRDADLAHAASVTAASLHVHDPTAPAIRDLARFTPPLRIPNVIELRQRLADDAFVYLPDNWDRRFEVRDRLPDAELVEMDGHGGSLKNAEIRSTTERVIRRVEIPPDDRPLVDKSLAFVMSVSLLFLALYAGGRLEGPIVRAVMVSKAVTTTLRFALPLVGTAITAALDITRTGADIAASVLRLLGDGLSAAADLAGRGRDPKVSNALRVVSDTARTLTP